MQKIGYIFGDVSVSSVEWMNEYGCSAIYTESRACYMIRPKWKGMLRKLSDGDELVVARIGNVLDCLNKFSTLLRFCKSRDVRLISIEDRIDTKGELFPNDNLLELIAELPKEILTLKKELGEVRVDNTVANSDKKLARKQFNQNVIQFYLTGFSLDVIREKFGISNSEIYRVLRHNGIKANRTVRKKKLKVTVV